MQRRLASANFNGLAFAGESASSPNSNRNRGGLLKSEGNVYLCQWEKRGRVLTLRLKRDPRVKASGSNLQSAEERMWERLCEEYGDGEAVLEYETPPPQKWACFASRYGGIDLVTVTGNDSMGTLTNERELHPKGYCRDCQMPLETAPGAVPEFNRVPSSDGAVEQSLGRFYSEEFLSLLSSEERAALTLVPVHGPKGSRKSFFHLGGEPAVNYVGVPGFEGLVNHQCGRCERLLGICYLRNCEFFEFIARNDLSRPTPAVFTAGWPGDVSLIMTRRRYARMIGKRGMRNIRSSRLWVVPDDQFVRQIDSRSHPPELRWAAGRFFDELR